MKKYKISYLFIILNFSAFAQRTETGINLTETKSRLILEVENDMLFSTDSYYTAGIALSYTHKNLKKTPAQFIFHNKKEGVLSYSGFGIQQRMFTPFSITNPNSIINDTPYSAYLLATNFSILINPEKHLKISNEIGFGVMGKAAGGKELQTIVHEIIGSDLPIGWEDQLENSFLIDYQFRIEKGFFTPWIASHFVPFAEARVGTLTNRVKLGLMTKWGNKDKNISTLQNSTGFITPFVWEWIFAANLQGVLYDATLEGGFNTPSDPNALDQDELITHQYQLRMGINLYYRKLNLRYMINFNSSNHSSALIHRYGSVNIGYSF